MSESKTRPTDVRVEDHLATLRADRQADALALIEIMRRVTGEEPRMWGPTMVGFGQYHYVYESGREGDAFLTGFASRAAGLNVYLPVPGARQTDLLAALGPHKMGVVCLTLRRLSAVDVRVLETLIVDSVEAVHQRYPPAG